MNYSDLLIEVHTGELPPKNLLTLANSFLTGIVERLTALQFSFDGAKHFATPRRLAVLVENLADQQPEQTFVKRGPSLEAAFDKKTNEPSKATLGFARSLHLPVEKLITIKTEQGEYLGYQEIQEGKKLDVFLPTIVEDALLKLPAPRKMRLLENFEFVRPIHSVILLFGDKVVPGKVFGIESNRKTRGHRFHAPQWIEVSHADYYEKTLQKAYVIVDFEKRKNLILEKARKELESIKNEKTELFIESDAFVNEVTGLVEWPEALLGSFDPSFLVVPKEALISSMQDHQRYFPIIEDEKELLPNFILISNIQSKDKAAVILGNQRVLNARLSDAAFFYQTDQKESYESRLDKLKGIIFQAKLGTLYDKVTRLSKLIAAIPKYSTISFAEDNARLAAIAAKNDLTTLMVGEFPELQGIMGAYYILAQTKNIEVSEAIREHYLPRFSGDHIPHTPLGIALSLVDRIDNLAGYFGINELPTGEKDPYGLRRAAISIIRILVENKIHLDLKQLIQEAINQYGDILTNKETASQLHSFFEERMKGFLLEQGYSPDVFAALNALKLSDFYDIYLRAEALQSFRTLDVATDLLMCNKRVSNILAKQPLDIPLDKVNPALFKETIEKTLFDKIKALQQSVNECCENHQYQKALSLLAELHPLLNEFFDKVMIMSEDLALRENRIFMLSVLRSLFMKVADFALLQ